MVRKRIWPIMLLFLAITLALGIYLSGTFLALIVPFYNRTLMLDEGVYAVLLDDRVNVINADGVSVWQSDLRVHVQDMLYYDVDHDGDSELALLCWKIGHFGSEKPFWVRRDKLSWSQHIYIYDYDSAGQRVSQKWMASEIGPRVSRWTSREVDGRDVCVLQQPDMTVTLWEWQGWGLKLLDSSVSFIAVGDNLIHESIYRHAMSSSDGFDAYYEDIASRLKDYDVAVVNQETPFVDRTSLYGGFPDFGTPVEDGQALIDAGFNVFTCATNHALDRGGYGIDRTAELMDENHVMYLGIYPDEEASVREGVFAASGGCINALKLQTFREKHLDLYDKIISAASGAEDTTVDDDTAHKANRLQNYKVLTRNGIRIALMNYTYGVNYVSANQREDMVSIIPEDDELIAQIHEAQAHSDALVLFMHWGTEYNSTVDRQQTHLADLFTECGVDVVVGTHPHVVQPYEMRVREDGHKTLIYYSLGNFVSGQTRKECRERGIATFTIGQGFDGVTVTSYNFEINQDQSMEKE